MKHQTCCFTGHRTIPENAHEEIQKRLETEIVNLIHQGVRHFCAGGARGFDTMAALTVLKLKPVFLFIRLILVLPCKEQTKGWDKEDIETYRKILGQADEVIYVSGHYHPGCMQNRNRRLVDYSEFCICYLTESKGGTTYTVHYARRKGLQVINLV